MARRPRRLQHARDNRDRYFDGYGLAMVIGDCWQTLCATIPGFVPLRDDRVLLAGVRDLEAGERERLDRSGIHRVNAADVGRLADELDQLQADRISLHIDLDVLDPAHGRANAYSVAPGITPDQLVGAVRAATRDRELAALTLSAYDPSYDEADRVRKAAQAALRAIARA